MKFMVGDLSSANYEGQKQYVCPEIGCGQVFKFASKLQKHESSHVKLESVEAICLEPGCMKHFTNAQCLKAHIQSCHQYMPCEICGRKQLRKNIKRHLRTHELDNSSKRIKCEYKGCLHTFSNKSNLRIHVKAVHFEDKPFTGLHVYTRGDFQEMDEQFRSRPRGGRKRKCPTVEMLIRKRVTPPSQMDSWLLDHETE
ncbi:Transcription factor IIIA like [Quillaja saponaria]|uniref:Transcription factor IIIA like n=1 Tax=Quillaja saponaria TaxID=32244 RepID=A0AAD7VNB2_QUISA|nr:Transcription factor IIIA like [Quillaja saponaria]